MVRVLVDATALPENRGGVGRYVDEVVARLPSLGIDTHVAAQPRDRSRFAAAVGPEQVHLMPSWTQRPALRLAWEQSGLPLLVRTLNPDVVHSPHYTLPLASALGRRTKDIVTVHDATFFSDPDLHLGVKARFFRRWTALSGRLADGLIAPSEATRREVLRYTHTHAARITVVPHGVDHERFRPPADGEVAELRQWLGLDRTRPYIAFLGTLEPRKNIPSLVRAYGVVARQATEAPALVLAGGKGWDQAIDPAVRELPAALTVLRPGFVPDGLVPALLGGAEVVAYPAHGEGFGLPVLEAMACGAAVLTTDRLSLSEVGGDAVRYARSPDPADLAEALGALLADPAERRRLGVAGLERASGYSWDATARGHVEVFERVVGG
jgi:glycosyltransferase involved in cell wall biosynthesis